MPGKIGVKIKAGRNLPVMDRSSDTTDAYVEIKLGNVTHKTDVCRKSLNPQWNTDWFRFEVDDAELQDEPLQIRLMDYDTYSANDAIGKVNISLNPLCLETSGQTSKGTVLSGWIPVFDTMHGIRGEVNVIVKVDLFSDLNKFRQSSCGIQFFHSQCIPFGYRAQVIHGFVEELVVNDDPEYQWIDKIRTPRASNEARQVVFLKLSGQVQRKMGLKAINMGANAVIGYTQCFDLEGDVGVVARGIGTAVTLIKDTSTQATTVDNALIEERTLKYLEFLTGGAAAGVDLSEQTEYKLDIKDFTSPTLYELKRTISYDTCDTEIMLDLIRQEDERGEKPAVKKLKHHVRRFTHSSRNIFNEKYNAFMRKLGDSADSKSSDTNTSRSLSSLFSSAYIKEEIGGTLSRSSLYEVRKKSFKAKNKSVSAKPIQRQSFKKATHAIKRSISDDTDVKDIVKKSAAPDIAAISEYHDSTRSSPNICSDGRKSCLSKTAIAPAQVGINDIYDDNRHCRFGQFSTHAPHLMCKTTRDVMQNTCSSPTISQTISSSSSSSGEEAASTSIYSDYDNIERDKVEKLLRMCSIDQDEQDTVKWIKPGENSFDDSPPDLSENHSILDDLKIFSQHVQDFIHMPKKSNNNTTDAKTCISEKTGLRPATPNTLSLKSFTPGRQRKSYYSSQPEILIDDDVNLFVVPNTAHLSQSRSLTNLNNSSNANSCVSLKSAANVNNSCANLTDTNSINITCAPNAQRSDLQSERQNQPSCPILKICPSTPTPSESGSSPSDIKFIIDEPESTLSTAVSVSSLALDVATLDILDDEIHNTILTNNSSSSTIIKSPSRNSVHINYPIQSNKTCSSSTLKPDNNYLITNTNANTNHSNKNSSLLVAPSSICTSTSLLSIDNINNNTYSNKKHHHRNRHYHQNHHDHHRSLNEISMSGGNTIGITDSPSMKRFASPASAAVVAAGATATNNMTTTAATISAATGPLLGSRTKLTASPSKSALTATSSTQSQSDSVSSATNSTVTTVIPKELGEMCRRSSDSDLSVTPKGNSLCVASERLVAATAMMRLSQPITGKAGTTDGMEGMLEYPFLTMTKYPTGFILHLGATVAARSVKLLERVPNPDEPEVRDSWWTELRMEIRSHARALGCNVVLGYSESTTISDDVCVLSATGTAAVINMAYNRSISQTDILTVIKTTGSSGGMSASLEEREMRNGGGIANEALPNKETTSSLGSTTQQQQNINNLAGKKFGMTAAKSTCTICHIPYNLSSVPFNVKMKKCAICRKGRVPDVLLATLEVPEYLAVTGRGCFMQAQVVRAKKDLRSELNAKEISDGLPFLEYELHRVLINKLKAKGMNAIFGLKAQVSIGERMIALIATGTALFLSALPTPHVPKIVAGNSWTDKQKLNELQKKLQETFERNQEIYQLRCVDPDLASASGSTGLDKQSDTDESDDEAIEVDLNCGNKDTCVLEVDDIEDLEIISLLMEPYPPEGFHVVNTQMVPGMLDMEAVKNLQMFTQVWRAKLDVSQNVSGFPKHFQRLLQTIYFKLRTMIPCAICDLRFRLDLPESDQIQLLVTGMALGLGDTNKFKYRRRTINANGSSDAAASAANSSQDANGVQGNKRALQEEDYIFPLDDDHMVETPTPTSNLPPYGMHSFKLRKTSPTRTTTSKMGALPRNRYFPLRDRYGVDITPLSFIPGGRIDKYLGNLNFFFIRESTSIRENGGISGFVHSFITELLAVVRAHISALSGNAMVSFYMSELILVDNQHKNQGQCLISIGGDAVYVSYSSTDD